MQVLKLLHEMSSRYTVCIWVVVGLGGGRRFTSGPRLWLTHIGRSIDSGTSEKHAIKRVDRLLGNRQLGGERLQWYQWIAGYWYHCAHPVVLVDWSNLDQRQELYVLRAALAVGGRAIPVYEEVEHHYASVKAEKRFLKRLKAILPAGCCPILSVMQERPG